MEASDDEEEPENAFVDASLDDPFGTANLAQPRGIKPSSASQKKQNVDSSLDDLLSW